MLKTSVIHQKLPKTCYKWHKISIFATEPLIKHFMETLINNFVMAHFATFVIACIVCLAIFGIALWFVFNYLVFKKGVKCEEHSKKIEDLGKASYDLPCKAHGEKLEEHGLAVQSLKTSIEYLNKNLERINSQMSNSITSLTQQHSPLAISERGWEVVKKLGIDKMFANNWPRIRQMIASEVKQKNAYDINDYCIQHAVVYPEKFLQQDEIAVLKNDAYIQGLALMDYMKIIAVMSRDKFFEENNIKAGKE